MSYTKIVRGCYNCIKFSNVLSASTVHHLFNASTQKEATLSRIINNHVKIHLPGTFKVEIENTCLFGGQDEVFLKSNHIQENESQMVWNLHIPRGKLTECIDWEIYGFGTTELQTGDMVLYSQVSNELIRVDKEGSQLIVVNLYMDKQYTGKPGFL